MLIIKTVDELKDVLFRVKSSGKIVGFVPTMGALHAGHLSLLEKAKSENNVLVCSIFVNPIQFNNKQDLEKYPRNVEKDINYIEDLVDILFLPSEEEVFPSAPTEKFDFGKLESVLEGKYRPGHFNGVATIVKRLFDWIKPEKAYFGEKDYQQLVIIRELVRQFNLPVQIVACPTVREPGGLAISSRNERLSPEEYKLAPCIYQILLSLPPKTTLSVSELKQYAISEIEKIKEFKLEYLEIVNAKTLQPITNFDDAEKVICCVALYLGEVRLIDNIFLKK